MRITIVAIFIIILLSSCSKPKSFPEKIAIRTGNSSQISMNEVSNIDLNNLLKYVHQYETKNELFDLEDFEASWQTLLKKERIDLFDNDELKLWMQTTGLLLELTQHEKYAAELERIATCSQATADFINPFIYTKNIDDIYVNIFQDTEINYQHSMKGEVTLRQETDYPKSGSVKLYFGMTERRYVELFIRIPDWAEGTTVTVKQVRYFAPPGGYCHIVKKWKEGDLVEIEFPIEKKPQ